MCACFDVQYIGAASKGAGVSGPYIQTATLCFCALRNGATEVDDLIGLNCSLIVCLREVSYSSRFFFCLGSSFIDTLPLPEDSSKQRRSSGLANNDFFAAEGGDGHVPRRRHHHHHHVTGSLSPADYSSKSQPTKRNSVSWLIAATLRTCKDSFGECLRQRRLQYSVRTHQLDTAIKSKVVAP